MLSLKTIALLITFLPLVGSVIAGFFGKLIGRRGSHYVTCSLVGISAVLSIYMFYGFMQGDFTTLNFNIYTWGVLDKVIVPVGFLLDRLTAIMAVVVTFVSFMVHIYTIGYMHDDTGYQRFFSYISLFTFMMLMLVMANNFLQLFFGWEGVGLVSYLLIGFWFKRETAIFANLKAFLVNRVGDLGLLLGIGCIFMHFGTLDYSIIFNNAGAVSKVIPATEILLGFSVDTIDLICICLFIGAMAKSAQIPLHVWLPDSMEGPTPISALIHAATMVTAGVFLVTRASPLFEYSELALNFILIIGATTCFFMGLLGVVQNDIKRIIAYSTLSQLGYMIVALGASAYSAGIFHLFTHAFFKALLFLGAGSVIIAMHHEQNIMKMGGLRKYLPLTYTVMLLGTLSLVGFPGFSGFYSKDLIIEAVGLSKLPASGYAYVLTLLSVFVTALYSFRLLLLVFHTNERVEPQVKSHLHEYGKVVTVPLILLAIPSVMAGEFLITYVLEGFFNDAIFVLPGHNVLSLFKEESFNGIFAMALHGFTAKPFWLAFLGAFLAWLIYAQKPGLISKFQIIFAPINKILASNYWFDYINHTYVAGFVRNLGGFFWQFGDKIIIDGIFVNGSAKSIKGLSKIVRKLQTGFLYHYVFLMMSLFFVFLSYLAWQHLKF